MRAKPLPVQLLRQIFELLWCGLHKLLNRKPICDWELTEKNRLETTQKRLKKSLILTCTAHPLCPPLLSRRGGRKRKRGRCPLFGVPLDVKRGYLECDVRKVVCSSRNKVLRDAFRRGVREAILHRRIAFSRLFACCKPSTNRRLKRPH